MTEVTISPQAMSGVSVSSQAMTGVTLENFTDKELHSFDSNWEDIGAMWALSEVTAPSVP